MSKNEKLLQDKDRNGVERTIRIKMCSTVVMDESSRDAFRLFHFIELNQAKPRDKDSQDSILSG